MVLFTFALLLWLLGIDSISPTSPAFEKKSVPLGMNFDTILPPSQKFDSAREAGFASCASTCGIVFDVPENSEDKVFVRCDSTCGVLCDVLGGLKDRGSLAFTAELPEDLRNEMNGSNRGRETPPVDRMEEKRVTAFFLFFFGEYVCTLEVDEDMITGV